MGYCLALCLFFGRIKLLPGAVSARDLRMIRFFNMPISSKHWRTLILWYATGPLVWVGESRHPWSSETLFNQKIFPVHFLNAWMLVQKGMSMVQQRTKIPIRRRVVPLWRILLRTKFLPNALKDQLSPGSIGQLLEVCIFFSFFPPSLCDTIHSFKHQPLRISCFALRSRSFFILILFDLSTAWWPAWHRMKRCKDPPCNFELPRITMVAFACRKQPARRNVCRFRGRSSEVQKNLQNQEFAESIG